MDEREVLARVRSIFDRQPTDTSLIVGNGDDGAVFSAESHMTVVATDMAVENVHFRLDWSSADQVGRKITAANLADICAMGGWPQYLLVSVAFPETFLPQLELLATGIFDEARKTGAAVIGGDLSKGSELVISITAIGSTQRAIKRSGAQHGDWLMISHLPGWSAAGLQLLAKNKKELSTAEKRAIAEHQAPEIDYEKYRAVYQHLTSATDISDGLLIDAGHLAEASDVAIAIDTAAFAQCEDYADLKNVAEVNGLSVKEMILGGGEDHVLLATSATPEKCAGFVAIGRIETGSGLILDGKKIERTDLVNGAGYQHVW